MNDSQSDVHARYAKFAHANSQLDLTRGKPSAEQLALSDGLEGILGGDFTSQDGTDVRGYGGLDGLAEAKQLGGWLLDTDPTRVLVGGNSSLALMHQILLFGMHLGFDGPESAWKVKVGNPKFLCPVPGYDRHFAVCEQLGIDMLNVPMHADGPDLDVVEAIIGDDPQVCGMWCVPKFSNPGGEVYSDAVIERLARIVAAAPAHFRLIWDNAYAVHALDANVPAQRNMSAELSRLEAGDKIFEVASTSKITFAGAGIAFLGASKQNLSGFAEHLAISTIGPDKLNQLRHAKFFPTQASVLAHMAQHAAILRPKFDLVLDRLEKALGGRGLGTWTRPKGGYFVSFFTAPGQAARVVELAAQAGVKLTPAGAAYPYGYDPDDAHIRLAPSFPTLDELDRAMDVFVTCVELAATEV
ncbi:MAG: aminotransferase [Gammaproteobacteria bacterium]|nr:aminotransferase [Gammaproteobacteria bacterium]